MDEVYRIHCLYFSVVSVTSVARFFVHSLATFCVTSVAKFFVR